MEFGDILLPCHFLSRLISSISHPSSLSLSLLLLSLSPRRPLAISRFELAVTYRRTWADGVEVEDAEVAGTSSVRREILPLEVVGHVTDHDEDGGQTPVSGHL